MPEVVGTIVDISTERTRKSNFGKMAASSNLGFIGGLGNRGQQGAIQGISSSSGSLASIVGLTVGGVLYTTMGTATFAMAGTTFALVCVLSLYLRATLSVA